MVVENPGVDIQIENAVKYATSTYNSDYTTDKTVKNITDKANAVLANDKLNLLLRSISHIDLTSLKGGETYEDIDELCKKAANAIDVKIQWEKPIQTAAVCIYPDSALNAIKSLENVNARNAVKVASVAGDFPSSKLPLQDRIEEIKKVVNYGVDEVDFVINRKLAIEHKWNELYDELKQIREACGQTKMKTILATGDLPGFKEIYTASMIAMIAGSDFIKTSTGKEVINATLPIGVIMTSAIKNYYEKTGRKVGFKPAGGIKTSDDIMQWMTLISEQLGEEWLTKDLFRIGASSVLDNIIKTVHSLC